MFLDYWKDVPGWESYYAASYSGKLRSLDRKVKRKDSYIKVKSRMLKLVIHKAGYFYVNFCTNGSGIPQYVHRIIAVTFFGECPLGMEVCHNNGYHFLNCVPNLRYDTHKNNGLDMIKHQMSTRGSKNPNAKLNEEQVKAIKQLLYINYDRSGIAEIFGVSKCTIRDIQVERRWGWLNG